MKMRVGFRFGLVAAAAMAVLAGAAAAPADAAGYVAPGRAAVARLLAKAQEYAGGAVGIAGKAPTGEHLRAMGRTVVVPDGHGGWITAIPVVRWPTADGLGQLVLFWHNRTFVGTSSLATWPSLGPEAVQVGIVRAGRNDIVLKYAVYRPSDPACCPTLPAVRIHYRWSGSAIAASARIPPGALERNLTLSA